MARVEQESAADPAVRRAPLQISGPAAGLTVIVAGLVAQFGWAVTCAITVCGGALQILFGLSRVARAALAISPSSCTRCWPVSV